MSANAFQRLQQLVDYHPLEAIKECEKILKKQPNILIKAYLALAYCKTGNDKATPIINDLISLHVTDPQILKIISICYRHQGLYNKIPEVYESIWKLNEELACQYFMALIRTHDFKKQQIVSSFLYKLTKKQKYVAWTGAVLYLQSQAEVDKKELLLKLGLKTFEKLTEKNWHTQFIYSEISKSLKLYENVTSFPLKNLDTDLQIIESFKALNLLDDYFKSVESIILRDQAENWDLLKEYAEECHKNKKEPIILQHCSISGHKNKLLFQIYFNHLQELSIDSFVKEYFETYGNQPSLFDDIVFLFSLGIKKEIVRPFLEELDPLTIVSFSEVIKYSNMAKFKYYLDCKNVTSIEIFNLLLKKFPPKEEKEANSIDDLLMLCVFEILQNSSINSKFDALKVLLFGIKHRKFNVVMKIWAIELLSYFKHPLAIKLYESLEIKNIQVDMLSYILLDKLNFMGLHKQAIEHAFFTSSLQVNNLHETPEMIAQAYHHETLINVLEFYDFEKRISNSLSRYCAQAEAIRGYMFLESQSFSEVLVGLGMQIVPVPDVVRDNRDYKIYQIIGDYKIPFRSDRHWALLWYHVFKLMLDLSLKLDISVMENLKNVELSGLSKMYRDHILEGIKSKKFIYKGHYLFT
eukprot:NODE_123_length_17687_cov_0.732261.p3 type:complete len:636 gc:universal NODE_123_length_17687_cov_0.732261:660-2567(+)